jgi:hypothetical protein
VPAHANAGDTDLFVSARATARSKARRRIALLDPIARRLASQRSNATELVRRVGMGEASKLEAAMIRQGKTGKEQLMIYAKYRGTHTEANFDTASATVAIKSGPLAGQVFASPSTAGVAVVQAANPGVNPARNGWQFWKVSETGEPLESVRTGPHRNKATRGAPA